MKENKNNLKFRMYGFVPYNISEIQKGIQFGHAVVEYANLYSQNADYRKWSTEDKTFVILDGGTTNGNPNRLGTLNLLFGECLDLFSNVMAFCEPDLGDQLTAFVFLVDERVWDEEKYPAERMWEEWSDKILKQRKFLKDKKLA